eukprot:4153880-Pyramimonas_sp.AAC.1
MCDGTGDISTGELIPFVRDCVAEVTDHSLVGFMAPTQNVSTEVPALAKLRAADVFKDEGVSVILDEGCNPCCRGKAWALNADDKCEKWGSFRK